MYQIMEEDVAALCGPEGKAQNPDRAGYRHSAEAGSVTLGGQRRVPVTRPQCCRRRVRGAAPAVL